MLAFKAFPDVALCVIAPRWGRIGVNPMYLLRYDDMHLIVVQQIEALDVECILLPNL